MWHADHHDNGMTLLEEIKNSYKHMIIFYDMLTDPTK